MPGRGKLATIELRTYNVLSSHLAAPCWFRACEPANLERNARYKRVLALLEGHMEQQAVLCLQEVSLAWASKLHVDFAARDYTLVVNNYGNARNGHMGCAIAFPSAQYTLKRVELVKVGASIGKGAGGPGSGEAQGWAGWAAGLASAALRGAGVVAAERFDWWGAAKKRENVMVYAELEQTATRAELCLATYHMPCMFGSEDKERLMVIHAGMAAKALLGLARGRAAVFAGDFNVKPADSCYRFLTSGAVAPADYAYPHFPVDGTRYDAWAPTMVRQFRSAYAAVNGEEPAFTNLAKVRNDPVFCDCLDYIFCTDDVEIDSVLALPERGSLSGPVMPTKEQPSDHLMIGARLKVRT